MTNEYAIQVVFKPEEAQNIRELARGQRISASAYIRSQLLAKAAPLAHGYWAHPFDKDTEIEARTLQRNDCIGRMHVRAQNPDFLLERVALFPDGTAEFRVYTATQELFVYPFFQSTEWHRQGFERGRIMIAGSHRLMKVISSVADYRASGQLRWLVAVDTVIPDQS
jgi:hypothetical protein